MKKPNTKEVKTKIIFKEQEVFKIKPTKPVEKALVLDPFSGKPLARDGEVKPRNRYWMARLRDKDIEIIEDVKNVKQEKK